MSDYISRQEAIEALASWKISPIVLDPVPSADVVEADKAQKEIDYWHDKAQSYEQTIFKLSLNKADVVEVVRCKDCKYGHLRDNTKRNSSIYCDFGIGVNKENYCSFGERAEQ